MCMQRRTVPHHPQRAAAAAVCTLAHSAHLRRQRQPPACSWALPQPDQHAIHGRPCCCCCYCYRWHTQRSSQCCWPSPSCSCSCRQSPSSWQCSLPASSCQGWGTEGACRGAGEQPQRPLACHLVWCSSGWCRRGGAKAGQQRALRRARGPLQDTKHGDGHAPGQVSWACAWPLLGRQVFAQVSWACAWSPPSR